MDNKNIELIEKIQKSNLNKKDKDNLIKILSEKNVNWDLFLQTFMTVLNFGKTVIELYGTI